MIQSNENRFKIIIVDDVNDGNDKGWRKVATMLSEKYLFPEVNLTSLDKSLRIINRQGLYNATHWGESDTIYLDVIVYTAIDKNGIGSSYIEDVLNEIEGIVADIWIIDINLNDFAKKEKEVEIDGFNIIARLSDKKGQKIIYSATPETKTIRERMKVLKEYLRGDLTIISIGNEDNWNEETEVFLGTIDNHFLKIQSRVISNLSQDEIIKIKQRLTNGGADLDCYDIEDMEPNHYWSLRTLFPKQINSQSSINKDSKEYRYIISVLESDYRTLICKLVNCHEGDDEYNRLKYLAVANDFKIGCKGSTPVQYNAIKQIERFGEQEIRKFLDRSGDNKLKLTTHLRDYVLAVGKGLDQGIDCDINSSVGWDNLVKDYGIYWGQLYYITRVIAINHIKYRVGDDCKLSLSLSNENDVLVLEYNTGKSGNNTINLVADECKFEIVNGEPKKTIRYSVGIDANANINPNDLNTLNSEQLQDILKIVCYKWRASFTYVMGENGVKFTWDFNKRAFCASLTVHLNNSDVLYKFEIPKV